MKKLLVTYKVQDADRWVRKNTLEQVFWPMGFHFQFFRKANTNRVGYIAEIKNEEIKTNKKGLELNLNILTKISPVTYNYKNKNKNECKS